MEEKGDNERQGRSGGSLLTEMKMFRRFSTYRDEDVQQVLQRGQLWEELLDHFAEGLEDGVVINTGQIEAGGREGGGRRREGRGEGGGGGEREGEGGGREGEGWMGN